MHTFIHHIKTRLFVLITICVCATKYLSAQIPAPLSPAMSFTSSNLDSVTHTTPIIDTISNYYYDEPTENLNADIILFESKLVVSLFKNNYLLAAVDREYEAAVYCLAEYRTVDNPDDLASARFILKINNNFTMGDTAMVKDVFTLDDVIWCKLSIDSVQLNGLNLADLQNDLFLFKAEILGEQYVKIPITRDAPAPVNAYISENGGYIHVQWPAVNWAIAYDLEYTFVDGYQQPQGTPLSLPYNFKGNSTRIRLDDNAYDIPLIFEQGIVVVRVRSIGMLADGNLMPCKWSREESGTVPYNAVPAPVILGNDLAYIRNTLEHEQGVKNWSYVSTFSDNGKREDVTQYFDGSMKTRQTVSRANTNGQHLIIQETIYDHLGRPAVSILPAPFKPDPASEQVDDLKGAFTTGISTLPFDIELTPIDYGFDIPFLPSDNPDASPQVNLSAFPWDLDDELFPVDPVEEIGGTISIPEWTNFYQYVTDEPAIRYQEAFNVNTDGESYSRRDFDMDLPDAGPCSLPAPAKPLGINSGAGQYYSQNNPGDGNYSHLTPNAFGYPFAQVEYTPDATGRINRSGNLGDQMQLGSGHEKMQYITVPSQLELDRIFGNDVGVAAQYKKLITRDPNGQISISYLDPIGNVIATALAGASPENLIELDHAELSQEVDIVEENTILREENKLLATRSIVITQDNTPLTIEYKLDPEQMESSVCNNETICDDCVYDLEILFTGDCGIIWEVKKTIGTINEILQCTGTPNALYDTTVIVSTGNYIVSQTLSVNADFANQYVETYLRNMQQCVEENIREKTDPLPCADDVCVPCAFTFEDGFYERDSANLASCTRACTQTPEMGLFDRFAYESMLYDLIPGGQYAEIFKVLPSGERAISVWEFPVSIFNPDNTLHTLFGGERHSYKNPVYPYKNADGKLAEINVTHLPVTAYQAAFAYARDGQIYVRPQHMLDLTILATIWNPVWSESLVPYHPEYAYYLWNKDHKTSIQYDSAMLRIKSFDAALAENYIQVSGPITEAFLLSDPFFNTAEKRSAMLNKLNNIPTPSGSIHVLQLIRSSIKCNSPYYAMPEHISDWNSCIGDGSLTDFTDEEKAFAWQMFRTIYLAYKSSVVDFFRSAEIDDLKENNCIGFATYHCPDCPDGVKKDLLQHAARRFQRNACFETTIPSVDVDGDGVISDLEAGVSEPADLLGWEEYYLQQYCGVDAAAMDWLYFISALMYTNKLIGNYEIPGMPPLMITAEMESGFSGLSEPSYNYSGAILGGVLQSGIYSRISGAEKAKWQLHILDEGVSWSDLLLATCIYCDNETFYIRAYTKSMRVVTISIQEMQQVNLGPCYAGNNQQPTGDFAECCPPVMTQIVPADPCSVTNELLTKANEDRDIDDRMTFLRDSIYQAMTTHCLSALQECNISWDESIYQYTIFYYDLNGNLISTVPPKGVSLIEDAYLLSQVESFRNGATDDPVYPAHNDGIADEQALSSKYIYNSLGLKLQRSTPDAGEITWRYNEMGLLMLSQNSEQKSDGTYSYILYDKQGRPKENGTIAGGGASPDASLIELYPGSGFISAYRIENRVSRGIKSNVHKMYYDQLISVAVQDEFLSGEQRNLRNRISATTFSADGTGNYDHAIHFSYNIKGDVTETVQEYPALYEVFPSVDNLQTIATYHIGYQHEKLSGRITQLVYQEGKQDQFYQWYQYDASGRIQKVMSGTSRFESEDTRELDVAYNYYLHGPVSRAEFGLEKVQGVDLAFTIFGGLKNINSLSSNVDNDPGHDGALFTAGDALAVSIHYFNNDYKPVGRDVFGSPDPAFNAAFTPQYNGNIGAVSSRNLGMEQHQMSATMYQFDQLYRLRNSNVLYGLATGDNPIAEMEGFDFSSSPLNHGMFDAASDLHWESAGNAFITAMQYDANGNITHLQRRDGSGALMDDLTYTYKSHSNQLDHISDVTGQMYNTAQVSDLGNQSNNNYQYDNKGRLIHDASESDATLTWNDHDLLTAYTSAGSTIEYMYNALSNRSIQKYDNQNGEIIFSDLRGKELSTYKIVDGNLIWSDVPIYAVSKIGVWHPDHNMQTPSATTDSTHTGFVRGKKLYHLNNHIGDVLAVVSDRKIVVQTGALYAWAPDIIAAQEYYPLGMQMPGRILANADAYDYGFQGMKKDDNQKGVGNAYTTYFRQYDPRVGRWLSLDPEMEKYAPFSPYQAFNNNSIAFSDPLGDDASMTRDEYNAELYIARQEAIDQLESTGVFDELARVSGSASDMIEIENGIQRRAEVILRERFGDITIVPESAARRRSPGPVRSSVVTPAAVSQAQQEAVASSIAYAEGWQTLGDAFNEFQTRGSDALNAGSVHESAINVDNMDDALAVYEIVSEVPADIHQAARYMSYRGGELPPVGQIGTRTAGRIGEVFSPNRLYTEAAFGESATLARTAQRLETVAATSSRFSTAARVGAAGTRTLGRAIPIVSGIFSIGSMVSHIADDAESYAEGHMGTGEYIGLSAVHIFAGVVGIVVPFSDMVIEESLESSGF